MRIEGISKSKAGFFVRLAYWFSQRRFGKVAGENREFEVADFPRLGKRMVKVEKTLTSMTCPMQSRLVR